MSETQPILSLLFAGLAIVDWVEAEHLSRSSESFQTTSVSGSYFKKAKEITTKQRNKTDEKTAFYLIGAGKF